MGTFATFERDLKVATAGLEPAAISEALAKFAKAEIARVVASGEGSASYDRYVNGRAGAAEETVEAPGPILYVFNWWSDVIAAAIAELVKRSPRKSGRYASSFIVIANQHLVTDYAAIPSDAEVIITNFQPYVRKVQVGAMQMTVPARMFDTAKQAVSRRFGNAFTVQSTFLNIGAGVHASIPYRLKGEYTRLRAARIANPKAFAGRSFPKRKDMEIGQPITYPALVMNAL